MPYSIEGTNQIEDKGKNYSNEIPLSRSITSYSDITEEVDTHQQGCGSIGSVKGYNARCVAFRILGRYRTVGYHLPHPACC